MTNPIITISMDVEIEDPQALWDAAEKYMVDACIDDSIDVIGPRANPDLGGCLIMLLDRSENLAGAEVQESRIES